MSDEMPESPESIEDSRRQTVVLLAILVEGGLLVGASFLGWMIDRPPLPHLVWTWHGVFWGVVATMPLILLFFLFTRWPIGPLERIQRFSERIMRPLLAPCSIVDLLGISVLAGIGEEMLFRGVLQEAFAGWFNVWVGILVASLLFGVLHSITVTYALLATVMGAYLGYVYWQTENLLVVIITHGLYDFIVLLWLMRGPGAADALAALEAESEAEAEKPSEPPAQ
jgi:membrane protease YdiL (CAAX protease family)